MRIKAGKGPIDFADRRGVEVFNSACRRDLRTSYGHWRLRIRIPNCLPGPILDGGKLVGIVSRANLIQALASTRKGLEIPLSDSEIRDKVLAKLKGQPWANTALLNITVNGGNRGSWV